MEDELPIFEWDNGTRFIAAMRQAPTSTPFADEDGKEMDDDALLSFISALWSDAYNARRAELERLKQNSLFYDGFHYVNGWMNRVNAVTNRIYSLVEAQVALAIAGTPRPEIVPYGWDNSDRAERLQQAAEAIMDEADFDQAIYLGGRDKFIFGYNPWLISSDHSTGRPVVKNLSTFDYYPDPAARNDDELHFQFIATAVGTHRLRATFPDKASDITSDHFASPSYEVTVKPWREFLEQQTSRWTPASLDKALAVHKEGETPTVGQSFTADTGASREHGTTTFLFQLLLRDEELVPVTYGGTWWLPSGEQVQGEYATPEPRCPSGWWVASVTGTGTILHAPYQLDPCFMGSCIVIDRNQQRVDRFESTSEVDHAIPIQRGLNRRKALMMRALELSANPPVIATSGHGMQLDKGVVSGGDFLTINRGSDAKYLEFRGPAAQQFEMYAADERDTESVTGVPDVQRGIKPAGVEAASAIRRLDDNSLRRMNAKENPAHRARSLLLRKVMYVYGMKNVDSLIFQTAAGRPVSVTPDELCSPYAVRMTPGTGTPDGRRDLRETSLLFFDKGILDAKGVLEAFQWPGRAKIVERLQQEQLRQELLAMNTPQPNGAAGGKPNGKPATASPVAA